MRRAMLPILLLCAALFAGGLTLEWEPFEGEYDMLVVKASNAEFEGECSGWGVVVAEMEPDAETGEFPVSVEIPGVFTVLPDDCIGCGLCVSQCPVEAIEMVDGKAVIDAESCIGKFPCYRIFNYRDVVILFHPALATA